jgi:hypothetical protein
MKKLILLLLSISIASTPLRAENSHGYQKSFSTRFSDFLSNNSAVVAAGSIIGLVCYFVYKDRQNGKRFQTARQERQKADKRKHDNEILAKENEEHERRMEEIDEKIRLQKEESDRQLALEQGQFDDRLREFDRKMKEEEEEYAERARKESAERLAVLQNLLKGKRI